MNNPELPLYHRDYDVTYHQFIPDPTSASDSRRWVSQQTDMRASAVVLGRRAGVGHLVAGVVPDADSPEAGDAGPQRRVGAVLAELTRGVVCPEDAAAQHGQPDGGAGVGRLDGGLAGAVQQHAFDGLRAGVGPVDAAVARVHRQGHVDGRGRRDDLERAPVLAVHSSGLDVNTALLGVTVTVIGPYHLACWKRENTSQSVLTKLKLKVVTNNLDFDLKKYSTILKPRNWIHQR